MGCRHRLPRRHRSVRTHRFLAQDRLPHASRHLGRRRRGLHRHLALRPVLGSAQHDWLPVDHDPRHGGGFRRAPPAPRLPPPRRPSGTVDRGQPRRVPDTRVRGEPRTPAQPAGHAGPMGEVRLDAGGASPLPRAGRAPQADWRPLLQPRPGTDPRAPGVGRRQGLLRRRVGRGDRRRLRGQRRLRDPGGPGRVSPGRRATAHRRLPGVRGGVVGCTGGRDPHAPGAQHPRTVRPPRHGPREPRASTRWGRRWPGSA